MAVNLRLLTMEIVGTFVVFGLALFLSAGTLVWPAGWVFLICSLVNVFFLVWLVLMAMDAACFHWSKMPVWLRGVGAILLLCSFYLCSLVARFGHSLIRRRERWFLALRFL